MACKCPQQERRRRRRKGPSTKILNFVCKRRGKGGGGGEMGLLPSLPPPPPQTCPIYEYWSGKGRRRRRRRYFHVNPGCARATVQWDSRRASPIGLPRFCWSKRFRGPLSLLCVGTVLYLYDHAYCTVQWNVLHSAMLGG